MLGLLRVNFFVCVWAVVCVLLMWLSAVCSCLVKLMVGCGSDFCVCVFIVVVCNWLIIFLIFCIVDIFVFWIIFGSKVY